MLQCGSQLGRVMALAAVLGSASAQAAEPGAEVRFNRDIRPILSDTCYNCHGPDAEKRQADLRLDDEPSALGLLESGGRAIVPGKPEASILLQRISSADPDERMPPAGFERQLTPEQVDLLKRWIEQGARWEKHWSFLPPQRPKPPEVGEASKTNNPIDHFILARLEREGASLSPAANRATLIRRVTLDLTGLPPTPDEVDAFLADSSPRAYEALVERLLASPRYGERMAGVWLDAARYADTSGYQTDGERHQWRWRDWVIDAFNRNMPFDQFTVEQVAGDLLPGATLDQQIATGFNRNHRTNSEGGIVFEEYLVEYAVDRLDTAATVWLGLTLGCARCHDHKYDPITQKEFYRLLAYFNNIPEQGRVIKYGNSGPVVKSPTPQMRRELARLDRELAEAEARFASLQDELAAAQQAWEAAAGNDELSDWTIDESLAAHLPLDGSLKDRLAAAPADSAAPSEDAPNETKEPEIPLGFKGGEPVFDTGVLGQAARLDGSRWIDAARVPRFSGADKVSLGAWFFSDGEQDEAIFSLMSDDDSRDKGYALRLNGRRVQVLFGPRWLDDAIQVQTTQGFAHGRWHHVMMTYDGSQLARGLKIYVDGELQPADVLLDIFTGTFTTESLLRIGSQGEPTSFRGLIDDFRYYRRELTADEVRVLATADPPGAILAMPLKKRTPGQRAKLAAYFLAERAPQEQRDAWRRLVELRRKRRAYAESIPTTMVMRDRSEPRETFVLIRGEYDKPGEPVTAGVPDCLSPLPDGAPPNRLGLARWLVDPGNPLVARVAVNRYWQMYFGSGLVRTVEDFGSQGEWPTHPDLLDWLATEFVRTGWDVKAMQRLIVTSAAYRQSSRAGGPLAAADPDNRLLARAPRLRLPAEMIRDQALAAGGLLSPSIGGPSAKVYQPEGLWQELSDERYVQDRGEALYRRSMYTFWKRTVPPPTMTTFDAPAREACTLHRSRTNTPLQALALMNDTTYVEAARKLAERVMRERPDAAERIEHAFRLVLARRPSAEERALLSAAHERYLKHFNARPEAAGKLLSVGEAPRDERLDPVELSSFAAVASLILNLDEAVMRE